ncbi:MAG: hypothetical protein IPM03_11705 [Sulfuritalea sp.]|nr:hypothetical protein [Sulfuritalea sp.]
MLHVAVLLAWKLPPELRKTSEHRVLTVVLRGVTMAESASEKFLAQDREAAVLVRKDAAPASFSVQAKPVVPTPAATVKNQPQNAAPGRQGQFATQANSGRASNSRLTPVGVAVLLVIGVDGHVSQIFWDKLPALTNEQFRRVEAAILAKTYAPGQTISEVFDVREFLKLPPVPTSDSDMVVTPAKTE